MGLEVVLNQILAAGQQEESNLIEQAQFERDRILSEAQARVEEIRLRGRAHTEARVDALRRELRSAAEFEARRQLLVARRELSEDFRGRVLKALASLPANRNQAMLTKLLAKAKADLAHGAVSARPADLPFLTKAGYQAGKELNLVGGFQVESQDRAVVLDQRYESLLENAWKQILAENQSLFEA